MASLESRIGAFLRAVDPLFTDEKPISFDPVQSLVLQKLVRPRALQAHISIAKEDFFKGVITLDYFAEVITGRPTVLEDVGVIVDELEKLDEYLDPDLELLVRYAGKFILKDLNGQRFFRKASVRQVNKRHDLTRAAVEVEQDNLDLLYLAAGRMVAAMVVTDEARAGLLAVSCRNDLRAGLLCDALLSTLPDDEVSDEARETLASGAFPDAAMALMQCLVTSCETWSMKAYVDRIHARLAESRS